MPVICPLLAMSSSLDRDPRVHLITQIVRYVIERAFGVREHSAIGAQVIDDDVLVIIHLGTPDYSLPENNCHASFHGFSISRGSSLRKPIDRGCPSFLGFAARRAALGRSRRSNSSGGAI